MLNRIGVNGVCWDKCVDYPEPTAEHLGIPASMDLDQLTLVGFPKEGVTVLGLYLRRPVIASDDTISVRVSGATGKNIRVDRSTNLVDWELWKTATLTNNSTQFVDHRVPTVAQFYRVQQF